jgi:hypothetical protein
MRIKISFRVSRFSIWLLVIPSFQILPSKITPIEAVIIEFVGRKISVIFYLEPDPFRTNGANYYHAELRPV